MKLVAYFVPEGNPESLTNSAQMHIPRQETLASAVELGRLRAVQRGDHLAGSSTDYSNFEDPRKAAIEAILKYHQHQDRSKHGNR